MADAHKNFAYSLVATAPSPATSGTSLVVTTGDGAKFPTPPFNAVIWPANTQPTTSNAEIVRVTGISTDTLTIARTQESTSARTVVVGDQISANITAKILTDVEAFLNPTGTVNAYVGVTAPTNWLFCDGSAVSRSTYATLFAIICPTIGTFTVTIASPGVVTLNGHGLQTGDAVYLTTSGALPTGLSANTLYYAIRIDANTFNLATSRANAYAATKINTSGSQSGTHTLNACPYGLGDGSTTFNLPDLRGRVPAGNDSMGGTVASRMTLSGSQGAYGNIGSSGGEQAHTMTTAEMVAHTHFVMNLSTVTSTALTSSNYLAAARNSGSSFDYGADNGGTASAANVGLTSSTGSTTAFNVVQPSILMNYIIKT